MSVFPTEGSPSPPSADEPAQPSGLTASHVAGGGGSVVVGAVVVAICNHYGWDVSDVDALVVGGAALSFGVGLGHIVGKVGILGAFNTLLHGRGA
jgi:hypothetical protein